MTPRSADPTRPPRSKWARWGWPIGIAMVLVLSAGSNIAIMVVARQDKAFAIEPEYYEKALHWDDTMAQERRNLALGWNASATLVLARPGHPGRLDIALSDGSGRPVHRAVVSVEAMHNARASQRYFATLAEGEAGTYHGPVDAHRPGEWEVRVTAQRAGDRFTRTLRLSVAAQ
jgi:nitrogen fixation protein FixH